MATPQHSPPPAPILDREPLLSVTTLVTMPSVRIGDQLYGLKPRTTLTLLEDGAAHEIARRLVALELVDFDERVAKEISDLRDRFCRIVLSGMSDGWILSWLPDLVFRWISKWFPSHRSLTDYQREEIVLAFCLLRWGQVAIEAAAGASAGDLAPDPSTSASSSRPSTGSIQEPAIG